MTTLSKIIARWDSNEGKPYKGSLIDFEAYEADPTNIGCMCAQGQVLHLIGGWTPKKLQSTEQRKADLAKRNSGARFVYSFGEAAKPSS